MKVIRVTLFRRQPLAPTNMAKRVNARPDDFRALTIQDIAVSKKFAATSQAILLVPYRKQKIGSAITNMALQAKS